LAEELQHPLTMTNALWFAAWVHWNRGERELSLSNLDRMIGIARSHTFTVWLDLSVTLFEFMECEQTSAAMLAQLHQRIASLQYLTLWRRTLCLCIVAEKCAAAGRADEGLETLGLITESECQAVMGPEILRIKGELMLQRGRSAFGDAARYFTEAIEIARSRDAKSFELRASTRLARLLFEQGRREEAYSALAGVYGSFTEGFDTADLKAAKALIDTIS
jgi:predicted negative regulator of RcsB-dependent stress response